MTNEQQNADNVAKNVMQIICDGLDFEKKYLIGLYAEDWTPWSDPKEETKVKYWPWVYNGLPCLCFEVDGLGYVGNVGVTYDVNNKIRPFAIYFEISEPAPVFVSAETAETLPFAVFHLVEYCPYNSPYETPLERENERNGYTLGQAEKMGISPKTVETWLENRTKWAIDGYNKYLPGVDNHGKICKC